MIISFLFLFQIVCIYAEVFVSLSDTINRLYIMGLESSFPSISGISSISSNLFIAYFTEDIKEIQDEYFYCKRVFEIKETK